MTRADNALRFGAPPAAARGAIVLLHGRGASPEDMQSLAENLEVSDIAFTAPAADGGTWYPQRFLAPLEANEPSLSRALATVAKAVADLRAAGMTADRIGLVGFSQGACLALEHVMRTGDRLGFVGALSGALIGPSGTARTAQDFKRMPVLIGCSMQDSHIPLPFVRESIDAFTAMNAAVDAQLFPGMAHTVTRSEVDWLRRKIADWK